MTLLEGFRRLPSIRTLPLLTASVARRRVLKKRAHHNHLSSLTETLSESSFFGILLCFMRRHDL